MTTMRAVRYTGAGGVEVIAIHDVPLPEPGPREIRVRVAAAGLNRADLVQRRGAYPAPPGWPADIPGLEYAGTVDAVGAGVTRWTPGDRVMGLVGGGGMAEAVVVHEAEAMEVPATLELVEAAAIPEAFLTAYDALVARARLARGERVLIHAVASGVGTAAVQLCRLLGFHAVGTSRSAAKLARLAPLGLEEAIDTSTRGFREQLGEPVHAVIDVLGGPAFGDNLAVLRPRGRLVVLGFLLGAKTDADLGLILRHRLEVIGSAMRTRAHAEREPLVREFAAHVLPQFSPGSQGAAPPLRPVVDQVLPMGELAAAHRLMERNETFGKLVLRW